MPELDGERYLSMQQVADALKVSRKTIKNWIANKVIAEPRRHPSNKWRLWTVNEVENIRLIIRLRNEEL